MKNKILDGERPTKKLTINKEFYSKSDPNAAEDYFKEFETGYVKLIKQLLSGKAPQFPLSSLLMSIYMMIMFFRNPSFKHEDKEERIDGVKKTSDNFLNEILLPNLSTSLKSKFSEKVFKDFLDRWSFTFVRSRNKDFITSDSPVVPFFLGKEMDSIFFMMPLSPSYYAVLIPNSHARFRHKKHVVSVSEEEAEYMNTCMAINSIREIYSKSAFEEDDLSFYKKWIKIRPKLDKKNGSNFFEINALNYPLHKKQEFSFMVVKS